MLFEQRGSAKLESSSGSLERPKLSWIGMYFGPDSELLEKGPYPASIM